MHKLLAYSGINTKIKALESKLISLEDYEKISSFETVPDFITFLKNHPGYSDFFSKYDEHDLHRADAERILINALYLDFSKIYRFSNDTQRKALDIIFFRFEVNILKSCIRMIFNNQDTYDLSIFHDFFTKHSEINVSMLAASHTIEEYINNLKGTDYYFILEKLQGFNNVTSFDYEMHLDIYYFKRTWKLKDKLLAGDNLNALTKRLGTEIDLLNIMWIYRSRFIYHLASAEIYGFMIPVNYKLSKEYLAKLTEASSVDEFLNILKTSYYNYLYQALQEGNMEGIYKERILKVYKENRDKFPNSMTSANYFLFLKENEINRLTTAVECIRYGLEPQDKLRYILQQ